MRLIEHFVAGTTARCAADLIGVNRNTAAYYFKRLREIITDELEQVSQEVFEGEIEVDESYFGGARNVNGLVKKYEVIMMRIIIKYLDK